MRKLLTVLAVLCALAAPGQLALGEEHEEKIYLDEEYDEQSDWALGIGLGLVDLGDTLVLDPAVATDDVEQFWMLNLRIPFGDPHAHHGSAAGGFRGYLEPELAYWDADFGSDLLVGVNIVGAMPFNAVEFYIGGGIGMHFVDTDVALPGGEDSDDALGVNAHFGLDVSLNRSVSLFGLGRFDLVDDSRDSFEGKAAVGLRFRF